MPASRLKEGGSSSRLAISVDGAALLAQMPLGAGQSASVPVTFAAGVRPSAAAEEVLGAEVCLEYVSPEAAGPLLSADSPVAAPPGAGGGGGAAQTVLGRHAVLPLELHVQPSLQVASVAFREVYLPVQPAAAGVAAGAAGGEPDASPAEAAGGGSGGNGDGSGGGSSATFERRCVMEATVANRGRWPLQVRRRWLGARAAVLWLARRCFGGSTGELRERF